MTTHPFRHPNLRPLTSNWHRPDGSPLAEFHDTPALSCASLGRLRRLSSSGALCNALPLRACAPASAALAFDERKLFIPTGKRKIKRDGQQGAEEKIPVIMVTATVTVSCGSSAFTFIATNRGQLVRDSRSGRRQPLEFVRQELHRMGVATAETIAASIAEILPPPRIPKPRPTAAPLPDDFIAPPVRDGISCAVKRLPFSARKHLLGDSIWFVPFGL